MQTMFLKGDLKVNSSTTLQKLKFQLVRALKQLNQRGNDLTIDRETPQTALIRHIRVASKKCFKSRRTWNKDKRAG